MLLFLSINVGNLFNVFMFPHQTNNILIVLRIVQSTNIFIIATVYIHAKFSTNTT